MLNIKLDSTDYSTKDPLTPLKIPHNMQNRHISDKTAVNLVLDAACYNRPVSLSRTARWTRKRQQEFVNMQIPFHTSTYSWASNSVRRTIDYVVLNVSFSQNYYMDVANWVLFSIDLGAYLEDLESLEGWKTCKLGHSKLEWSHIWYHSSKSWSSMK